MAPRLTPEQQAYMIAHRHEDRRSYVIGMHTGFLMVGIICIVLRFMSRIKIGAKLGADDWLILAALFALAGHAIPCMIITKFGVGRHVLDISDPAGIVIANLVGATCYSLTLMFTKLSILALYHRIFSLTRGWIPTLWGFGVFVLALGITQPFVYIFQCIPLNAVWAENPQHMKCINFGLAIIILGSIHIVTDWLLLFLPIPVVLSLQLSKRAKISICSLFAVGAVVCIISIIRLQKAHELDMVDPTWNYVPIQAISTVEGAIGILAACMPTWRPLFRFVGQGLSSYLSSGALGSYHRSATHSNAKNKLPHSSLSSNHPPTPNPHFSKTPANQNVQHLGDQPDDAHAPARAHKSPWLTRQKRSESNTSGDSVERMLQGRVRAMSDDVELGDLSGVGGGGAGRSSEDVRTAQQVEVSAVGIGKPQQAVTRGRI